MSAALRRVERGDRVAVAAVIEAAFGGGSAGHGPRVARLWDDVRRAGLVLDELLAEDGGVVAGHVGVSHAWLDARRALVDVAVLSPLSTAPGHRCRGTGTALLAAAVDASRATGRPLLLLEGDPGFYGARGFEPAARHGVEPATRRTPEPALQVVRLDGHQEWMTGRLVYPDVWWRHDAAGLRDPDLAAVERSLAARSQDDP